MVITRRYAAEHNIKLHEGLPLKNKNITKNDDLHYVFKFLIFIWVFTLIFITSSVVYNHLYQIYDKSINNFIITDIPEKTIIKLYNSIPARPYNYILDMFQDYNIDYF